MKSVFKGLSFILLISFSSCLKDSATTVYDLGDVAPFQAISLSKVLGTHMYESFEIEGKGGLNLINGSYFLVPDFDGGDYVIKNIGEDENLRIKFKISKNDIDKKQNGLSLVGGFIDSLKEREKGSASACILSTKLTDSIKLSFEAFSENSKKDLNFYELIQREGNFDFLLEAYGKVNFTEKGVLYNGSYYDYPKVVLDELEQKVNGYIGGLWQLQRMYNFLNLNQRHFQRPQKYMRFVNYLYLCRYLKVREYMQHVASSPFIIKGISQVGDGNDTLFSTERYDVSFKYSNLQDFDVLGAKIFRDWSDRIKWHHNHFVSVGTLQKSEMRFSVDCIEYREVNLPFVYHPSLSMVALANNGNDTITFKYNELWRPIFYKDELTAVPQLNFGTEIGGFLSADRSYHFIHHKSNDAFNSMRLKAKKDTFQTLQRNAQVSIKCITTDIIGKAVPSVPVTLTVDNAPISYTISYTISNANGEAMFSRTFPSKGHFEFSAIVGDWRSNSPNVKRAQEVRFVFEVR